MRGILILSLRSSEWLQYSCWGSSCRHPLHALWMWCVPLASFSRTYTALQRAVPETLHGLVEGTISQPGRLAQHTALIQRKSVAIEQAIMSTIHPGSFLSPLLIDKCNSVYLHRKYEWKSHRHITCFWLLLPIYMRRLGDISGQLSLVHPHSLIMMMHLFSLSLTMLTTTSSLSMDMAPFMVREYKVCHPQIWAGWQHHFGQHRFGDIPYHHYTHDPKSGLALIDATYMSKHMSLGSHLKSIVRLDSLWLAFFALGITPAPGWSGFNQLVTERQSQSNVFHVSDVVALPFINFNRSDMSTIYTALMFAKKEASLFNGSHCIGTFDQPLFIKAVDYCWCQCWIVRFCNCASRWLTHDVLIHGLRWLHHVREWAGTDVEHSIMQRVACTSNGEWTLIFLSLACTYT